MIAFDISPLLSRLTHHSASFMLDLIQQLAKDPQTDGIMLYSVSDKFPPRIDPILASSKVKLGFPPPMGFHGIVWRWFQMQNHFRADGVNLFHGISTLPLNVEKGRVPVVLTLLPEDLKIILHPESGIDRFKARMKIIMAQKADFIILHSLDPERDREKLLAEIKIEEEKILLAPKDPAQHFQFYKNIYHRI